MRYKRRKRKFSPQSLPSGQVLHTFHRCLYSLVINYPEAVQVRSTCFPMSGLRMLHVIPKYSRPMSNSAIFPLIYLSPCSMECMRCQQEQSMTDGQTDGWTDGRTERWTYWEMDRQTDNVQSDPCFTGTTTIIQCHVLTFSVYTWVMLDSTSESIVHITCQLLQLVPTRVSSWIVFETISLYVQI